MHESIVEAREDVRDSEDKLALCDLGTKRDSVFFFGCLDFLGRLWGEREC